MKQHAIQIISDSVEMWSEDRQTGHGMPWKSYKNITTESWNRIMYVTKKYNSMLFAHEIRFTGQESSPKHPHVLSITFPRS